MSGNTVKAVVAENFKGTRKQIDKMCADVEVVSGQKAYWFRLDDKGELTAFTVFPANGPKPHSASTSVAS